MRTFYIFKINSDYYKLTKNIPSNLYEAYLNIKIGTRCNINLLFNEYKSITDNYSKNRLNSYIYNKMKGIDGYILNNNIHTYNNYYTDEKSTLNIYNSYMIIRSNSNTSYFFNELLYIPNLFVIDFESEDFFWLSNIKHLRLVNNA